MSARTFTEQRAQYGKEADAGTAVAATSRPSNATLELKPKTDSARVRPSGEYFDTLVYLKREQSEGSLEGTPDFGADGADQLELVFGNTNFEQIEFGISYRRFWELSADRKTWTVQYGDATDCSTVAGVFATGIEMEFGVNSGDSTIKIDLEGGALTDGGTLTPGTTAQKPSPVRAANLKVYVDDDQTTLGETEVSVLRAAFKMTGIAALVKMSGGDDTVNTAPDATVELKLPVGEVGKRFLDELRSSTTKYVRLELTGAPLAGSATGLREAFTIDCAVQGEGHERGNEDEVYAATVTLRIVSDSNGFSHRVSLVNDLEG